MCVRACMDILSVCRVWNLVCVQFELFVCTSGNQVCAVFAPVGVLCLELCVCEFGIVCEAHQGFT